MLFMLIKVNNITLKNKMLLKEKASNSNIFDPSKMLYNVTSKFNVGDKGKTIQMFQQSLVIQNVAKPNRILKR